MNRERTDSEVQECTARLVEPSIHITIHEAGGWAAQHVLPRSVALKLAWQILDAATPAEVGRG